MATVKWARNGDGDWSVPADWTGGALPGPGDSVTLNQAGAVTVTHGVGADTIARLATSADNTLSVGGGVLTVTQGATIGGPLALSGGTLALSGATNLAKGPVSLDGVTSLLITAHARFTLSGALTIGQTSVVASAGSIEGPGTLITQGLTTLADNYRILTIGDGLVWSNSGTVVDGTQISVGTTIGSTATFLNAASGVFDLTNDASGIAGAYVLMNGTYVIGPSTFGNVGLLEKTGGTGTSSIAAFLTNTGRLSVTTGELSLLEGGSLGGTITGGGTLAMSGGSFALKSPVITDGTVLLLSGGTLALAIRQVVSGVGLLSGAIDGRGTLISAGLATLAAGAAGQSVLTIGGGARLANNGTLVISSGLMSMGDQSGWNGSVVNAAGAVIDFVGDASIANGGTYGGSGYVPATSTLTNAGLLEKTGGTGTSMIASYVSSTGTISATSGTLDLTGGGTIGGVVTGGGTVLLGAGRFALKGARVTNGTSLILSGGTVSIAAGGSLSGLIFTGGTIDGPGTLINTTSTTLQAGGLNGAPVLTLGGGLRFSNTGTVSLSTGGIATGDQSGLTASLSNAVSGVFDFTGDGAISNADPAGTSTFANAGLLEKTGGTGTSVIASALTSTGTIRITSGALDLTGGGTLGGTITGGGTLLLGGGAFTLDGPAVTGGTSVVLAGGTLAIAFGTMLSGLSVTGGEIDGPGTLANSLVLTLAPGGATVLTLGGDLSLTNNGTLVLSSGGIAGGDAAGSDASLTNEASGVVDFTGDAGISNGYNFGTGSPTYGNVTFVNLGLLEKTGGGGTSDIVAVLTSTGTINVTSGAFDLLGGGTLGGTITGGGTVLLGGGGFVLDDPLIPGGTSLVLAGGTVAVANGTTLATLGLLSGEIDGPGTFATTGATTGATQAGAVVLGGQAVWRNSGTSSVASLMFGSLAGGTATLVNAAGGVFVVGALGGARGSAVQNAGSLDYAATGVQGVFGGAFISTGTLTVETGTLDLTGGGALSGTITGAGQLLLSAGTFAFDGLGTGQDSDVALAGGTLTLAAGGTATLSGGLSAESGAMILARASQLDLSGAVSFGVDFTSMARVDGPGTLVTSGGAGVADTVYTDGTALLLGGGIVWRNSGFVQDAGFIRVGDGRSLTASLVNTADGVFELTTDDGGIGNNAVLSPAGVWRTGHATFANAGFLAKTGGIGQSFIAAAVTNTGTIDAASGTLDFLAKIGGTGTLLIEPGATLETVGFAATQSLGFDGAGGTLLLDAAQSVTTPIAGLTVGDSVDLSFAASATASITGNTLSITPGGGTAMTFLSGSSLTGEAVSVTPDGNGGTLVTLAVASASSPAGSSMAGTTARLNSEVFPRFAAGAVLDVTDLRFGALDLGFGGGKLSVNDGTRHATFALPGVAALADIRAAANLHGGTLLSYHPT